MTLAPLLLQVFFKVSKIFFKLKISKHPQTLPPPPSRPFKLQGLINLFIILSLSSPPLRLHLFYISQVFRFIVYFVPLNVRTTDYSFFFFTPLACICFYISLRYVFLFIRPSLQPSGPFLCIHPSIIFSSQYFSFVSNIYATSCLSYLFRIIKLGHHSILQHIFFFFFFFFTFFGIYSVFIFS